MMRNQSLERVPVLRADGTYCSPACGAGCTLADFEAATQEGKRVAELLGEGWIPTVGENLHWFWTVRNHRLQMVVSSAHGGRYLAIFGLRWAEIGDTPQQAVKAAVAVSKTELAEAVELSKIVEELEVLT